MTLPEIKTLGKRILRAIDTGTRKTLGDLVLTFAAALALDVDKRRSPTLAAGKWDADDLARLRKLVAIELRYLDGVAVEYLAPDSREVIDHLEARVIARARLSYDVYVEFCFTDETGAPIVQAPMHRRWTQLRNENRKLALICHNEAGKSQQNAIYFPVYALGKNPNLRVAVLCNTNARAADILRTIADAILNNPHVRAVFPHLLPGPLWSSTQIQVERSASMKDPSVSAFGIKSGLLGQRCDLVVADDLLDSDNVATLALQESLIAWWRSTVETRLTKNAQVIVIGTPWTPTDLLAVLETGGAYRIAKFPILDPVTGKSTWPSQWDAKRIEERRDALKEVEFSRAMLLNPRADAVSAFKEKDIDRAIEAGRDYPAVLSLEDLPGGGKPSGADIFVGVDLASGSTKKRRDNSAIAVVMIESNNKHTLLSLTSGRWTMDVLREKLVETNDRWAPKVIAVESNGMQAVWVSELKKTGIPIVEHLTSVANKFDGSIGVEGQAILFANGLYVIPRHVAITLPCREFVRGLLHFSRFSHLADEAVAAWIAFHAGKLAKRAARPVPEVTFRTLGDGDGDGERHTFADSADRDRYLAEKARREAPPERSFSSRVYAFRDPSEEEEADARAARYDRRHRGAA